MSKIEEKFIKLTAEINALDFLEQGCKFIKDTEVNPLSWKWVIISLHGALYGFAICACKGTNPKSVTFETIKSNKLVNFWEALKKCQDPSYMCMTINSKHLKLSEQQKESIEILTSVFRNNFEHYIPKLWSIEIHGLPRITIDVLDVISFLALETGNYVNLGTAQRKKVDTLIRKSKKILLESQLSKELQ